MATINAYPCFMDTFYLREKISYIRKRTLIRVYYAGHSLCRIVDLKFGYMATFNSYLDKYINDTLSFSSILIVENRHKENCNVLFQSLTKRMLVVDICNQRYPVIYVRTQFPYVEDIDFKKINTRTNPKYINIDLDLKVLNVTFDDPAILKLMHAHYISHFGQIPCFGKITGYIFYQDKYKGYEFDTEGKFIAVSSLIDPSLFIDFPTLEFNPVTTLTTNKE